jgi:N-acetylglucosaminyldiphosphoundecaprenol N-acetyl-beta-D-mannosaminyltransferase
VARESLYISPLETEREGRVTADLEVAVVDFGVVPVHAVTMPEAVDLIAARVASGRGGFVLTPNVDHLSLSRRDPEFAAAYRRCFLSLADGMPLVLVSRLLRLPVREKVSGSDLFEPLMARCAQDGIGVFFLGATTQTCEAAAGKLRSRYPAIQITGYDASAFDLRRAPEAAAEALRRARESGARLIVVCLPPLKQLMLARFEDEYRPAVGIGAGSTLAFYVGDTKRAPAWMSRSGLEWLFRLAQEPRRLWRRYLVEGLYVVPLLLRMATDRVRGRKLSRTCRPASE